MKKRNFILILIVTILVCCQCRNSTPEPYKWEAVDPISDSIVMKLDRCFNTGLRGDTIDKQIEQLHNASSEMVGKKKLEADARTHFFNAKNLQWKGFWDEAIQELDSAYFLCDTIRYPYTTMRIKALKHLSINPQSTETFKFLLEALKYYQEIGDLPQQAETALFLSQSLNLPDEPGLTLHYFKMADSIYTLLGNENYHTKNRINEAYLLFNAGETELSNKIFNELLENKIINADTVALEMVLRNRAVFFNDTISLRRGYNIVNPSNLVSLEHSIRALYEGLLCEHFTMSIQLDSAAYYASLCEKHFKELKIPRYKSVAAKKLSDYYEVIGDERNNLKWMKHYSQLTDSIVSSQGPGQKIYLNNLNTLRQFEFETEIAKRELRNRYYIVIGILVIVLLFILGGAMYWRQHQKLKTIKLKYELERSNRKVMAMSFSQNEAHKVIDYVEKETSRLSREEGVSIKDITDLKRNIKIHQSGTEELIAFEEAFSNIHPDFVKRLKDIAPALSENNIRLCSYIVIGLSNHQIAKLLNVQPNSLKQSRWRLRTKLKVPQEDSLEDFLRHLSEN